MRHEPQLVEPGVDATFLLVDATVLATMTPVIEALLRWRRSVAAEPPAAPPVRDDATSRRDAR